ncbi:PhoPQ-activated pathogenicity-related protein [Elusimicrobium posterum]|uniref:hypothetical protein n=1 Tax=Elusimicrobium posterum TaxID=3116653 RepID=UPI003C746F82
MKKFLKQLMYVALTFIGLFIVCEAGFFVWKQVQIKKAEPKVELLITALEKALTLQEQELEIKKKYGKSTFEKCYEFRTEELKKTFEKNSKLEGPLLLKEIMT